jgi:hypothetical protein
MKRLSVKELHIYVTQGLQRQGSYRKDKQLPQAIDLALCSAEGRLIKSRLFPVDNNPDRFEINQKFSADIQPLVKLGVELDVYKEGTKSLAVLPYDFGYLLSDTSYIIENCQTQFTTPVPTETKTERVISFPISSAKSATPYYLNMVVAVNSSTKIIITTGFQTKEEKTSIVDSLVNAFKELGVTAYWERYKDIYRSECLLLVTKDLTLSAGVNIDGGSIAGTTLDNTITVYKSSLTNTKELVNRGTKLDFLRSAQQSHYHKSDPDSPLSVLADNKIMVVGDERFLANKIVIDYIRRPKRISLSLNQSSELPIYEEIGDMAIQILKKQIEDETYQLEVADNKRRIE